MGKAYSGVTDAEIARLTQFFLEHTVEDYGSVRAVEPLVVFEVAFNNVMRSDRHDSGFALRFPRILRIRDDKPVSEIDTLERVAEIYHRSRTSRSDKLRIALVGVSVRVVVSVVPSISTGGTQPCATSHSTHSNWMVEW